jgi:hypothetical protein
MQYQEPVSLLVGNPLKVGVMEELIVLNPPQGLQGWQELHGFKNVILETLKVIYTQYGGQKECRTQ